MVRFRFAALFNHGIQQAIQLEAEADSSIYKAKEGRKLTPLATEEQKQQMQIGDLTYDFACRITRLFQYLTEDSDDKEYIMSKQVYRSGTSVGANVREAKHAQSDFDFLSKYSIAYKEADETEYWLSLLHDNGYLSDSQFESIHNDCVRIIKVLTVNHQFSVMLFDR